MFTSDVIAPASVQLPSSSPSHSPLALALALALASTRFDRGSSKWYLECERVKEWLEAEQVVKANLRAAIAATEEPSPARVAILNETMEAARDLEGFDVDISGTYAEAERLVTWLKERDGWVNMMGDDRDTMDNDPFMEAFGFPLEGMEV